MEIILNCSSENPYTTPDSAISPLRHVLQFQWLSSIKLEFDLGIQRDDSYKYIWQTIKENVL